MDELKIGDTVRVIDGKNIPGFVNWNDEMTKFVGSTYTIKEVISNGVYILEGAKETYKKVNFDTNYNYYWYFSERWLLPVDNCIQIEDNELNELFGR